MSTCPTCKPDVKADEVLTEDSCNNIFLHRVEPCMVRNKGLVSACAAVRCAQAMRRMLATHAPPRVALLRAGVDSFS